jgi:acetylornithine deacetylase/succinyl-diaminopimelate desuccinylase-like protein
MRSSVSARLVPGSVTAPMLTPRTTDSRFFRRKGINTCGLFLAIITPEDLAEFHGIEERISLENLRLGTRIVYEVLKSLCHPRAQS